MKKYTILAILVFALFSCNKEVSVDQQEINTQNNPKILIENDNSVKITPHEWNSPILNNENTDKITSSESVSYTGWKSEINQWVMIKEKNIESTGSNNSTWNIENNTINTSINSEDMEIMNSLDKLMNDALNWEGISE